MSETSLKHRICGLVLDTSALLLVAEGVNSVEEALEILRSRCSNVKLILLTEVTQELSKLASGRGRKGIAARLALAELGKLGVEKIESVDCDRVDDCILKYSLDVRNLEVVVLTADRKLAKILRENNVRHIIWWKSRRRFVLW
ncbi:MAG: hypothetical protein N3E43_01170 [Sulfolobales archaeon]|nr:hypothetical protein [Sulfolobales archaeon]